jgi:protease-4
MGLSTDTSNDPAMIKILEGFLNEQRRKRRWGLFFKLVILVAVVLLVLSFCTSKTTSKLLREEPHTAVINVNGEIVAGGAVDADKVVGALRQAFKDSGTKGIILRINSPGGSPVQSDYIFNEIMRLRKLHPNIPVYAVCTDMCASGAYFIAAAATDIYANPASLVGSIGVIMNGFGFTGAMDKLGITRRTTIAGKYKDFMDPFAPQTPEQKRFAQAMVDDVHQQFILAVEQGRGKRLHKNADVFSGMAWTGNQAKKMGLIDGFGNASYVAREIVKQEKMVDYTIRPSAFEQLANRMGASMADVILSKFNTQVDG